MGRRIRLGLVANAMLVVALAAVPGSLGASGIRATLDGRPITLERAATLSCHDFDFPVMTCFETASELQATAQVRAGRSTQSKEATSQVAATGYIVVFEHGAYAGAAQALSVNYSYLGSIGWNDKISSLKSYGASGRFYEHSPGSGLVYYFGTASQITYVGDAYNDKFSALYLN